LTVNIYIYISELIRIPSKQPTFCW